MNPIREEFLEELPSQRRQVNETVDPKQESLISPQQKNEKIHRSAQRQAPQIIKTHIDADIEEGGEDDKSEPLISKDNYNSVISRSREIENLSVRTRDVQREEAERKARDAFIRKNVRYSFVFYSPNM